MISCQLSVISYQWSVVSDQKSVFGSLGFNDGGEINSKMIPDRFGRGFAKHVSFGDHAAEDSTDFLRSSEQVLLFNFVDIAAIESNFKPVLGFLLFCICIDQFGDEGLFIHSFPPCFGDLSTDRSGRPAYLVCQRVSFLTRESFRQLEHYQGEVSGFLITNQVSKTCGVREVAHMAVFSVQYSVLSVQWSEFSNQ